MPYLERTFAEYTKLINELIDSSNLCVDKYGFFVRAHAIWRWTVIISTGMIALLNIVVNRLYLHESASVGRGAFGVVTSVFGVVVTILATLEGFTNAAERAQSYRQSREMFLDVSREYTAAWETYVGPLSDTAEACTNAAELYRRLIVADRELRSQFRELTMARQEHGGAA